MKKNKYEYVLCLPHNTSVDFVTGSFDNRTIGVYGVWKKINTVTKPRL